MFNKFSSFEKFYRRCVDDKIELQQLVEVITINETSFFRLSDQFQALRDKVLPGIEEKLTKKAMEHQSENISTKTLRPDLRIWSAGCSSGEEPYSIAMTVMDSLKFPRAWQIEILATDYDPKIVKKAVDAMYNPDLLKRIPKDYRKRFMRIVGDGEEVCQDLKSIVFPKVANLRDLIWHGGTKHSLLMSDAQGQYQDLEMGFDIIFCRNVMIYFDFAAQENLVEAFFRCLKPGGFFFIGDTESLNIYQHQFETIEWQGIHLYYKP